MEVPPCSLPEWHRSCDALHTGIYIPIRIFRAQLLVYKNDDPWRYKTYSIQDIVSLQVLTIFQLHLFGLKIEKRTYCFTALSPSGCRIIIVPFRASGQLLSDFEELISLTRLVGFFSVQSPMELCGPEVVQRHARLLICTLWACPWAKKLWYQWAQILRNTYFFKSWVGQKFYSFETLWNLVYLQLRNVMIICPFDPHGLANGPKPINRFSRFGSME